MELRSSRSRSRTPFVQGSVEREMVGEDLVGSTTFRTTRSTTRVITSNYNNLTNNIKSSTPERSMKTRSSKSEKVSRKARYKTSDYSSEEGEALESSKDSTGRFLEESSRRSEESHSTGSVSAIDFYRAAGDYWNKYPKTDYTYSLHSKDRTELAPGVLAMPNMSRRSLHGSDYSNEFLRSHKETNTHEEHIDFTPSHNYRTEEVTRLKQRNLFSNNNHDKMYQYSAYTKRQSFRSRTWSALVTVVTWITSIFYYTFTVQNSIFIWFAKILHRVATRVMLWDSWLLRSVRKSNKVTSLIMLCVIPLLVFGGWWLLSQFGPLLYDKYRSNDTVPSSVEKLSVVSSFDDNIIRKDTVSESLRADKLSSAQIQEIANTVRLSLNMDDFYNVDSLVHKIVSSPNMQNVINNCKTIDDGKHSAHIVRQQQEIIDTLRIEIDKIRLEQLQLEKIYHKDILDDITRLRVQHDRDMASLNLKLNRCCRNSAISIEGHITRILKEFFNAPRELHNYKDISRWLHSTFVAKQDLETHLANITHNLHSDFDALIKNNGEVIMNDVMAKLTYELSRRIDRGVPNANVAVDSITDEYVKGIVRDSLAVYDADKTGLVDYALESAGGEVVNIRCTEGYNVRTAVYSIFGIPIWYPTNNPRTAITPGAVPGECWAFQNFPGFLLIKLSARVKIEAFSMEHISKMLSPNGKIDSAPKEFHVFGLQNATDPGVLIGEYFYDENGPPLQYFAAARNGLSFPIVELKIMSNHGNLKYTCLYRFRVHGKLDLET
ncbi:hypothetical protein PPYR_10260 [Photinus pyralis]|uniref:SUN domain-containing protein n=1 Tax=Photinus pyralis TaxID=7054 RepID=A0A1Y1K1G3_PHOPY|nr:SUN domain-containing protein 2 isoform X2 [Photinus pyralis]KAB0796199.1 hypothetical protein PPYR_10260 [Photinus pyralis]